jgi:hypothetical protein
MPIKPENKHRYPPNWKQIRAAILEREGNACKFCKAENHTLIARGVGSCAGKYMTFDGEVRSEKTGEYLGMARGSEWNTDGLVEIVLTIAHLDHTPENNDPENLAALCQKCHLAYDKEHHLKTAAKTRHNRKASGDMFA